MMTASRIETEVRSGLHAPPFRSAAASPAPRAGPVRGTPPAADILVELGYITVRADLPGIPAENVEVTVTSRYVEIVGWPADLPGLASYHMHERPSGVLRRTLPLPEAVLAARSEASLNGGVIEIRIPRRPVTSGWTVGAKEA